MAFKMKGSSYKMGGVKTKDTMAYMNKSPLEQSLSWMDKMKAGVSAVADWDGPFSDYSLYDGYKHKKKQIRKGDEVSSRDSRGTSAAKMKSPMEMGSAFLTGSKEESELKKGQYKGGSLYDYLENPTEQDAKDALGYASFLENSGNTLYAERAANIRTSIAEDLSVMENDRVAAEETEAEDRRFEAEEGGPQG